MARLHTSLAPFVFAKLIRWGTCCNRVWRLTQGTLVAPIKLQYCHNWHITCDVGSQHWPVNNMICLTIEMVFEAYKE